MDKAKLFAEAEKSIVKGNFDKALQSLEVVLRKDHNDVKALNKSADIFLKVGNIDKAVEYLRRIGEIYTKEGFFSKAIAIYKRILKLDHEVSKSEMMVIHEQLAELYGQLGLVSDSMNHFSIVVDFYDQNDDRQGLLGVLRKVADLDPYNVENQLRLVDLFIAEEQKVEAAEALSRVRETAAAKGNAAELIRILEKWVSSFPEDVPVLKELVSTYVDNGEPKRALARIQQAFRKDPYNTEILELLAGTFDTLHQTDKAKAVKVELLKVYRKNGDNEKAIELESELKDKSEISTALPEEEREAIQKRDTSGIKSVPDDAIDPAESLIAETPLSNEERKVISECEVYLKYGLLDKAEEVLRSQLQNFSKSLAIRWKLKAVCSELNKKEDAAHLLSEIVMLGEELNQTSWVTIAQQELKSIDPNHISAQVASPAQETPLEMPTEEPAKKAKAEPKPDSEVQKEATPAALTPDFDQSEISIVLDEDDSLEDDISLFDETTDTPKPTGEEPKPASLEQEAEEAVIDLADDDVLELVEESPEPAATSEEAPIELDLSEEDASLKEVPPLEVTKESEKPQASEAADDSFDILTEDDFSDAELQALGSQLDPTPDTKEQDLAVEENSEPTLTLDVEVESMDPEEVQEAADVSAASAPNSASQTDIDFELKQGLEEVDFFREQGLHDEAAELIESLKQRFPDHPHWTGKKSEESLKKAQFAVDGLSAKAKVTVQEDERDDNESDFFDLAGELDQEIKAEENAQPAEIQDVFNAFKQGVKSSVKDTDFQTHFDLGVAYREMGLIDDAIEEFKLCQNVSGKESLALYQLGVSEAKRQNWSAAKTYFDQGLQVPELPTQEKIGLSYELADVLLKLEDKDQALALLEEVRKLDPEFREVEEKIQQVANS